MTALKCVTCGRFMRTTVGASWRMVYSGFPPMPDHEQVRCAACTMNYGPLEGQPGIKPECAAGMCNADTTRDHET